jgi:D-psicose/D-tagatose/L-ribulose 3-epimerase
MRIGMNLLLWTGHLQPRHRSLLDDIRRAGYDGVEIPNYQGRPAEFAPVGRWLDEAGLARTAATAMTASANPISPDRRIRQAALDYLRQRLDCCAAAGVEMLVGPIHSALGVFSGKAGTATEWKRCADVLARAAEHAATVGVRLALEPLNRFESYLVTTAADGAALVAAVSHPSLGMMFDTFHANIEEKDPQAAFRRHRRHIIHVHISENDRGTPGEGHIDWPGMFRTLRACGYDGWLTVEAFGRGLPQLAAATRVWRDFFPSPTHVCRRAIKFIRRSWEEAGT